MYCDRLPVECACAACACVCFFRVSETSPLLFIFENVCRFVDNRIGRGIITFSPGKLDMAKAPPAAYHKMLCYVLQEVRQAGEKVCRRLETNV